MFIYGGVRLWSFINIKCKLNLHIGTIQGNRKDMRKISNDTKQSNHMMQVLIFVDYDKCVEAPGFCLNGATCQRQWTSARCHCATDYYGERCSKFSWTTVTPLCINDHI